MWKDTVQVVVFNPHETNSTVSQDGRQRALLLFIHQQGHKMLDLGHVHITAVITADQDLNTHTEKLNSLTFVKESFPILADFLLLRRAANRPDATTLKQIHYSNEQFTRLNDLTSI